MAAGVYEREGGVSAHLVRRFALRNDEAPQSSPGLTGRSSTPWLLGFTARPLEYWIPAFAGMTAMAGAALATTGSQHPRRARYLPQRARQRPAPRNRQRQSDRDLDDRRQVKIVQPVLQPQCDR